MHRITKRVIDGLKATGKEQFLWDAETRGFGVRASPDGRISYVVQYRFEGRQRRYRIGAHGSPWTPETARIEARRLLGELAEGSDPQQRRFDDRTALDVAGLCDLYLEEGLLTAKPSSVASARCNVENHIKPLIGSRRASALTRGDIEAMIREIASAKTARRVKQGPRRLARVRGGKGAANSALVTLSAALGFGVLRQVRPDNPAIGIRKFPGKKMERFLSPAELARLGQVLAAAAALGVESPFALAAIRLLMLTGCRKNEILTLRRAQVDRYHRCLRLADSKTGAKIVHIGAAVMRVIETIPEIAGNPYLLPGKTDGTHVTDLQSVWERIRKAAELADVRLHDLRHSFASVGAATGDSMLIIGALLGHSSPKTTARYTHLADHPLKSAADRISDAIAQYLGDPTSVPVDHVNQEPSQAADCVSELGSVLGTVVRTRWLDTPQAAARIPVFNVLTVHFVLQGTGYLAVGEAEPLPFAPSSVLVVPAMQAHWVGDAEPAARVGPAAEKCELIGDGLVEFTAGDGAVDTLLLCAAVAAPHDTALGLFDLLRRPVVDDLAASGIPTAIFETMRREVAHAGLGTQAMCQALMKQALVTLLRVHWLSIADGSLLTAAVNHPRLARAVAAIIEHPGARHTVDSLAELAGMSRASFSDHFSRTFGQGPIEFVQRTRLRVAARLLNVTDLPVKAVAASVGYAGSRPFSRAFETAFGVLPTRYREQPDRWS